MVKSLLSRLFHRPRPDPSPWIEADALKNRLGSVTLLDVRQPEEYDAPPGHLPTARNVPLAEVTAWAAHPGALDNAIVLVCKTDRRSARAAETLRAAGARNVSVLRGGTDGWHLLGLPLEGPGRAGPGDR